MMPYLTHILMKCMIFLMIMVMVAMGVVWIGQKISFFSRVSPASSPEQKQLLLSFPMKETNWKDIGVVPEPLITLDVKTVGGYKENKFLLDSGAVISSLPREWAEELGYDLALLPRSVFGGFGGLTSTAYQGEMKVKIGEEDVMLPVVFTEATGVKSLLGRKEFFNRYSIVFNHETQTVEIRK